MPRRALSGLVALCCVAATHAAAKKNVLLVIVDDLRPDIAYGYNQAQTRTPNIDRLAGEGTVFHNAYCQQAICGPTRNSFLSGRRPQRTQSWNFRDSFREVGPEWKSLPQYFKEHGYTTLGAGKTYHPNIPPNNDAPLSWSDDRPYQDLGDAVHPKCHNAGAEGEQICVRNNTCDSFTDCRNAQVALGNLRYAVEKQKRDGSPFFVAYGAHRPHLPFTVPQEYWEMYANDDIALPKHEAAPTDMPPIAFTYEIDGRASIAVHGVTYPTPFPDGSTAFPHNVTRALRRGYYSAVTWTDHMIGMLLDELRVQGVDEDTVVALIGDHGWQLGEHNIWGKHSNFELATRVPLIFRSARAGDAIPAGQVSSLVESLDLYPTLAALAGLPPPEDLDGVDLSPLMKDTDRHKDNNVAFSEYPRCPPDVSKPEGDLTSCVQTPREDFTVMGYSVRTTNYRYTVWLHWDGARLVGDFDRPPVGEELYPHVGDTLDDFDAFENENKVRDPQYADVVKTMYAMAKEHWEKKK